MSRDGAKVLKLHCTCRCAYPPCLAHEPRDEHLDSEQDPRVKSICPPNKRDYNKCSKRLRHAIHYPRVEDEVPFKSTTCGQSNSHPVPRHEYDVVLSACWRCCNDLSIWSGRSVSAQYPDRKTIIPPDDTAVEAGGEHDRSPPAFHTRDAERYRSDLKYPLSKNPWPFPPERKPLTCCWLMRSYAASTPCL